MKVASCIALLICFQSLAAWGEQNEWRTGPEFNKQLEARLGIKWVDNSLRSGLQNLSRSQGVAVFLDRRVDPGGKISLNAENQSLRSIFESIAGQLDLGVSLVDAVVYIGPKETAARLATLVLLRKEDARRLPPALLKRVADRKPLAWEALATPKDLVEGVVKQAGARSPDTSYFPHDLWPAGDWPPLSTFDRLTLLLAGFDMTFEFVVGKRDELTIELVKMPPKAFVAQSYKPAGDPKYALERLAKLFPAAEFQVAGGKLEVHATAEDQGAIERALRGESPKPRVGATAATSAESPVGEKRYTLKTARKPFQALAGALAKQLGLEIAFDPSADAKLAEPTSIDVSEATLEELLEALVKPLGLRYELQGKSLRIVAQ